MKEINAILEWMKANPELVTLAVGAIWELIFRVKPTQKDWSLINFLAKIIDYFIKNKKSSGGVH